MKVTILYGSATGNAEHIAKDLANSINNNNNNGSSKSSTTFNSAEVMELNHFKRKKLMEAWIHPPSKNEGGMKKKHAVIIVCSTTGNGDPPENAGRFVRYLKKPPPSTLLKECTNPTLPLQNVAYSVLGLGDTNYDQFCATAKVIDKKMGEWGATRGMELVCADEATGLEGSVEPWLESVLERLASACTEVGEGSAKKKESEEKENGDEKSEDKAVDEKLVGSEKETKEAKVPQSTLPTTASAAAPTKPTPTTSNKSTKPTITPPPAKSPTPLYILYGSATGNAEHIAKDLTATYQMYLKNPDFCGYFTSVECCELNLYKKKCLDAWSKPPVEEAMQEVGGTKHGVIIVCSTTGNADAPENADRFVRWIKRKSTVSSQPFQHCAYAVLGLGDTNYDVFCATAKVIDGKLSELGGRRVMSVACADEAVGLEEVVEPWVGCVIGKVAEVCKGCVGNDSEQKEVVANSVQAEQMNTSVSEATASDVVKANGASDVSRKFKEEESSASSVEEKKMEVEEIAAASNNATSVDTPVDTPAVTTPSAPSASSTTTSGVQTIRNLLSLPPTTPLPTIPNSSLPAMVSSLSSCQLIHDTTNGEGGGGRLRGDSLADNMTVSSGSSGFLYTAAKPYESRVLGARYLTKSGVDCAKQVTETVFNGSTNSNDESGKSQGSEVWEDDDDKLMQSRKLYEQYFPLSSPATTTIGSRPHLGPNEQQQLQYDKNSKRVIELTLSLPSDFTLEYEPGDSVGLIVPNSPHSVKFILEMLKKNHGISKEQKISVDAAHPITVEEAVRNSVDLGSVMKKKRLFLLSMYATDPEEERALRLLSSKDAELDLFQRYVEEQHRTVVDILQEFPSCQSITLEGLLGCLPAIPPRYYSVCSSPLLDRQQKSSSGSSGSEDDDFHLKVAFSVVDYMTPALAEDGNSHRRIGGLATSRLECVCSPYLSNTTVSLPNNISNKPTVQIFPKPTHEFRLPSDMSTPLILIGPGTGIAPFIGFLSHRQAQLASLESTEAAEMTSEGTWRGGYELDANDLKLSKGDARGLNLAVDYMSKHQIVGEIDLFFGCRYEDHDYLYQKELEEFKKKGILTNLYTAFSRESGKEKMYVQTLMQTNETCGKRLVEMIMKKQASVYICGDGNAMGKDVQEAIVSLLAKDLVEKNTCGLEEAKVRALAHVDQMKTFGRFVLDIWS